MSISYLTGIPRSGKTYYAVYKIYDLFLNDKKSNFFNKNKKKCDYEYLYTNINEFKFDKSDKFLKFDFSNFYFSLENLYNLYTANATDELLNEKASEMKLNHCLIVIDEAHNFFNKKNDEILTWWLTYHGHLYQDIILITQDLSLIDTGYKAVAEFFIKAIEPARRILVSRFKYRQYASHRMLQSDILKGADITLRQNKEVFDLYHSGAINKSKSFVLKIFIFAFFGFLFVFSLYMLFMSLISSNENNKNDTSKQIKNEKIVLPDQTQSNINKDEILSKPNYFYFFLCDDTDCKNSLSYSIDFNFFVSYIQKNKPEFLNISYTPFGLRKIFVAFNEPILDIFYFDKGAGNEKNIFSSIIGGDLSKGK